MSTTSQDSWWLVGLGAHRSICVELSEPIAGSGPWLLQIDGQLWQIDFEVTGKEDVLALCDFVRLSAHNASSAQHRIGANGHLVKDDEGRRFFLRVASEGVDVRIAIQDDAANDFQSALENLVSNLNE